MTFFSFKKKSPKTGITLMELLVVITIIVIISAIMVINFRAGERGGELVRSAQLLVQGVRKAQNMALGSKEVYNPGIGSWEVSAGGYGVYLTENLPDNGQYIVFADFNNDDRYDSSPQDEKLEDGGLVEFEKGIIVDNIFYDPSGGEPDKTNITFDPLDPLIRVQPLIPPANEVYITLKREGGETCSPDCREGNGGCSKDCKVIEVTKAGWITIVD